MIIIAGIVISLFLSLLLLTKKNKGAADRILLLWMVFITLHQLYYYFDHSAYFRTYPAFVGFDFPLPLLHGPLLFLYAAALVGRLPEKWWQRLAHFIPALACLMYMTKFFMLTGSEKYYIIDNEGVGYELFLLIRFIAIILSGIVYVVLTLILLNRHQRSIRENFSDIEHINLKWLQYLTAGISLIWISVIFGTDEITFSIVVIFVLFIGIYGIRQTPIFASGHPLGTPISIVGEQVNNAIDHADTNIDAGDVIANEPQDIIAQTKYRKSGLSEGDIDALHRKLTDLMLKEALYTQPDITLGEVARRLDTHPNYLSQVINARLQKTFYDYINAHRVEAFIQAVNDPRQRHYTLLAIAFQCGFNSKSSFNRNFKKVMGESPSDYLDRMQVVLDGEV